MSTTPNRIQGKYYGEKGSLFILSFVTGALTILTLGIYRFWGKSRIRRYIWSATAPNGDPMEYTGTGTEKFIGFLIAVVFLAIYLGTVQVLLSFGGFAVWDTIGKDPASQEAIIAATVSGYVTFLAVLPLLLFARYRARRYMLSRTRWRGVRFAMDKGAGGYVLRGLLFGFLTVITLGVLWPLMTFTLEKYMTDRTWYGDAQFEQEGRWTELYRSFKHMFIGLLIMVIPAGISGFTGDGAYALISIIGFFWFIIGLVYYRVDSFRRMAHHKVVDDVMTFEAVPTTGFVIKSYLIGSLVTGLITSLALIPVGIILGASAFMGDQLLQGGSTLPYVAGAVGALTYFFALLIGNACTMIYIVQPIFGHFVDTATLLNAKHLDQIAQRVGDDMPDAEGFADALDMGGAF